MLEPMTFIEESQAVTPSSDFDGAMEALAQSLTQVRTAAARVVRAQGARETAGLRVRVPALHEVLSTALLAADDAARALERTPPGGSIFPGYASALEDEFRRAGLDFEGQFPEYEMFPLTVRINPESETVRIGRKTVQALDPRTLARMIQAEVRRLHRSSFNADRFLRALALCYDALSHGTLGATVPLIEVYKLLSVRTGSVGYTRQEFAFDIYRVRRQSDMLLDDKDSGENDGKRKLEFIHGKKGSKIAVPRSQGGVEEFTAIVINQVLGYA